MPGVAQHSGGVWHDAKPFAPDPACGPFEDGLVHTVGSLGKAAIPTLWVYALNDPWFQPQLVRRMAAAYRRDGGNVDLTMMPSFGRDGHTLYLWEANALTQPSIDRFLRANALPAMTGEQAFIPILATLAPDDRNLLKKLSEHADGEGDRRAFR